MATTEMDSVTQELSEPEEENEKKVRDDVPKPVALQAPALRTNVAAAWEDPGHTSASMGFTFACF